MIAQPKISRRGWLALWAQNARRRRLKGHYIPDPDLTRGLVAHFGLDESNGDRTDSETGYTLASVDPGVGNYYGIFGYSAHFDGCGGYLLSTDETTAFSPTSDGFTISVWVNFAYSNSYYSPSYIASVWDDANWPAASSWHICSYCPVGGDVTVELLGTSMNSFTAQADLISGWTHICLVFDAGASLWSLYLNGVVAATLAYDYRPVSGKLGVGRSNHPTSGPSDFLADELAIWSRNLTEVEVAQLYNNGSGLPREQF